MRIFVVLTILLVLLSPMYARAAAEPSTIEIGVRGGKDFSKGNADESYDAAEIYLLKKLPWGTTLGEENKLTSRFDIGATYLEGGDDEGTMLAAGVTWSSVCGPIAWNWRSASARPGCSIMSMVMMISVVACNLPVMPEWL